MINEEQKQTMVNDFDNADVEDKLYKAYLQSKLEQSKKDIEDGRVITLEQLKKHINELEKKYETDNI